ncbi:TrmH family RNA methyltransferase [Treponema sp. R80B11-R83G3]
MIPLYKLEKLPRTQKLRKIAKIFTMAEAKLSHFLASGDFQEGSQESGLIAIKSTDVFNNQETAFFADTAKILAKDGFFSTDAKKAIIESMGIFQAATTTPISDLSIFLRALNNVKHILLAETGKDQADWDFTVSDGRLDPQKRQIFKGMWIYMEDIRSPFNVGAMFRTAESFGVEKIILSPLCADPRHKRSERTAMGCVDVIPWERQELFPAPENSPTDNFTETPPIFALETGGTPLAEFHFPRRGIMIIGSEELGVSPRTLAAADASLGRVTIPCYGAKGSLNVSVAFGIAIQAWGEAIGGR